MPVKEIQREMEGLFVLVVMLHFLLIMFTRVGNWKLSVDFIRELFTLNYMMATYSKPQVFILNGIVMGGGLVVSVHGRFRVATEKTVCAMPETALGIVPGASHFYSRIPGFFGEYAGLTGARLDGAEMLDVGLATHFVPSEKLPFLKQELAKVNTSDADVISVIISLFSTIPNLKAESPCHKMKIIDRCFSQRTIEEIISSLIREGRQQDVGSCLIREYRMLCHALKGELNKDFVEGCRATLIDKDRNPKWEPSRLELIRDDDIDRYFSKIDDEDWEDLKLPPRSNLLPYAIAKL
ncbi:hypothetical protein KY285_001950 [Solanum tuberosum]|nr:hypothetical protein KY285_001950 [Solanum tuberosum]